MQTISLVDSPNAIQRYRLLVMGSCEVDVCELEGQCIKLFCFISNTVVGNRGMNKAFKDNTFNLDASDVLMICNSPRGKGVLLRAIGGFQVSHS